MSRRRFAPAQIRLSHPARRSNQIQAEGAPHKCPTCVANLRLTLAAEFHFILGIAATEINIGDSDKWFYNPGQSTLLSISAFFAEKEVIQ